MTRTADRRLRRTSVLNVPIKIEVRSKSSLKDMMPTERAFLDSLCHLAHIPDTTPAETLERLSRLLKHKVVSFDRLYRLARNEPPRVRALLGALGESIGTSDIDPKSLDKLRSTLNPLTTYKLHGAAQSLTTRSRWNLT
jgi:hypothetical protein